MLDAHAGPHTDRAVQGADVANLGGTPVSLVLQVPDVDAAVAAALAAGTVLERPVATSPDGRRSAWLVDPFGHRWNLTAPPTGAAPPEGEFGGFRITRPLVPNA